uniref:Uncharacterized protein n=1 Tax=Arundo donax TaxID=35708 RepID=A0A0A9FD08_ARUDO
MRRDKGRTVDDPDLVL